MYAFSKYNFIVNKINDGQVEIIVIDFRWKKKMVKL